MPVCGALNDPFPMGYSMLNFGAIIQSNSIAGRQPWIPASQSFDTTIRFSIASSYVNYYDAMDNLSSSDFRQAAVGFYLPLKRVTIKGAGIFFNALGLYEERMGQLSFAALLCRRLQIGAEMNASRASLYHNSRESETLMNAGFSLRIPWHYVSATLGCKNITVEDASQPGFDPPLTVTLGLHTIAHRLGAQGITLSLQPQDSLVFSFCIGEEFFIHKNIAITAGLCSKPLMVGFGFSIDMPAGGVYTGMVYHPALGWSQGIGMEYVKR